MSKHENSRNHTCESCEMVYKSNESLKRHITNVHENKRNHKCELCEATFHCKTILRKHFAYD